MKGHPQPESVLGLESMARPSRLGLVDRSSTSVPEHSASGPLSSGVGPLATDFRDLVDGVLILPT